MYIQTKDLTLEDGEHEVVLRASDKVFSGYDIEVETNMIQKKDGVYIVREQETWDSLPIYEIKNCTVVRLDFTQYEYFTGIKRRKTVSEKIRKQYNPPSENKIMRKTLKKILDHLGLEDEKFSKYNQKVEEIISKIPKKESK